MIIDKQYSNLWQACAKEEGIRPILECIYFGEYDSKVVAVATDGFVMAVVPVEKESVDSDESKVAIPVWVYKELNIIPEFRDNKSCKRFTILEDGRIESFGRKAIYPTQNNHKPFDWKSVIQNVRKEKVQPLNEFNFDVSILNRLCRSIGIRMNSLGYISMVTVHSKSPIVVQSSSESKLFTPPFGLIMPTYKKDSYLKELSGGEESQIKS